MGRQLELRHAPREVVSGHLLAAGSDLTALHGVVGQGKHNRLQSLSNLWVEAVGLGKNQSGCNCKGKS
jgi:hypothetical protein